MRDPLWSVVYCGNWGLGLAGLEVLLDSPVRISRVFTRFDPRSSDRFLNLVQERAAAASIPVINSDRESCSRARLEEEILACGTVDFLVVCCFDRILTDRMLRIAHAAAVNVHTSVLPRFRGEKPLENAIVHGERYTGVTIHELVAEVDAGDIILQDASLELRAQDTYGELVERQSSIAGRLLWRFFESPLMHLQRERPQDVSLASFAPRLPWSIGQTDTVDQLQARFRQQTIPRIRRP